MSARKSTNKAATDSPVSTCSESSSIRSTTTRSSVQTPVNELDPLDSSMTLDIKRPRRTNVRTPTTPSNNMKKKSDESPETMSTGSGGDVDDDKSIKSPSDDSKSEDGKKTDGLTDSPVRAGRKRKVFDKTAIVTRKTAMNLVNNTKRILRDRRSSIGKGENVEGGEPKKRGPKKSLPSTPESLTSLKRKRANSIKTDEKEETKRVEKVIKLEPLEGDEISDQMQIEEEDKLKQLVEETDSKDDELIEVLEIKQEIDEETEDAPLAECVDKESKEESESVVQEGTKLAVEQKSSEGETSIVKVFEEQKEGTKTSPTSNDQKDPKKVSEVTATVDPNKKCIVKKEEAKAEEDAKYEAYERPRRARTKRLTETPPTSTKRGVKKNEDTPEAKTKTIRRNQSKSLSSDRSKSEELKSSPNAETKATIVTAEEDEKNSLLEPVNGIVQPLTVDTTSSTSTAGVKKEVSETNSDENSEKAPSLSPELVSEGVNVVSVKQFYKKPEFLENNLGIEKDPKLGEIVQKVEKDKDERVGTVEKPSKNGEIAVGNPGESVESSPDCSGDSLKEGERLVLDDSTEDDASSSIIKVEGNDNNEATCVDEVTEDFLNSENSVLSKLKEAEEMENLSNSASTGDVDALQTNCDKNSSNSAVVADDGGEEEEGGRGDSEIKDKIACNKSSNENVSVSDKQGKVEDCLQEEVELETNESGSIVEEDARIESDEKQEMLLDDELEDPPKIDNENSPIGVDIDETVGDESDTKELVIDESQEQDSMDVDEINENKENVADESDDQDNKENMECRATTPKKVSITSIFPFWLTFLFLFMMIASVFLYFSGFESLLF